MNSAPLILIPVRGGSKGIPRKNLREVAGISLVGRAVRAARDACARLGGGRVIVDSDDAELLAEGRRWGAETPYVRPAHLATDTAGSMDVVRHALDALAVSAVTPVVLVQATSPLVTGEHIAACVRAFDGVVPVVSVAPEEHHPAWAFDLARGVLDPLVPALAGTRRQDLPAAFRLTGAVYVGSVADVRAGKHFVQPGVTRAVTFTAPMVDIDSPADLAVAEALATAEAPTLRIGERIIGGGRPCYIIAEAGVNHDGDFDQARRLIDAAAKAGADAVKFQTWQTELICRPGAATAAYQQDATGAVDQFTMLKALELPYAWHVPLRDHAASVGIQFLSTPDEIVSARFLAGLDLPLLKIGSAELDNLPFLDGIGRLGLPLLLSTGMGELPEVARAVDTLRAAGCPGLALFQCVSDYPAPLAQMNLRAIATLRRTFNVPAGLSDHFPGVEAALAAVGVGMDIWEKHFTTDRTRPGPDHRMSLEPAELAAQITAVRAAEQALGDGRKVPQAAELSTRAVVRKRLCAARALPTGHVLTADDLTALRAERGLPVADWHAVLGRTTTRAIEHLEPLEAGDVD
jgi:N-acetylneuraminate synthase/N,N'-diacetyllegionaminate synthase